MSDVSCDARRRANTFRSVRCREYRYATLVYVDAAPERARFHAERANTGVEVMFFDMSLSFRSWCVNGTKRTYHVFFVIATIRRVVSLRHVGGRGLVPPRA
jgi:hypothetical protein